MEGFFSEMTALLSTKVGNVAIIDLSVVTLYMLLCLVFGLRRMGKKQSVYEYALGSRNFSTAALILTIYATYLGAGSTIGTIEKIGMVGALFAVAVLVNPIKWLFTIHVFGKNIESFYDCLTLGDVMEKLYGSTGRYVSAIVTVLSTMSTISAQAIALGYLMNYFLGLPVSVGVVFGVTVIMLYSIVGGVKAVVLTDMLQATLFYVMLPILAVILLHTLKGWDAVYAMLPADRWTLEFTPTQSWVFLGFLLYTFLDGCSPAGAYMQRFLMSKNSKQLITALKVVMLIDTTIVLLLCASSMVIAAHVGDGTNHSTILWYLIDHHIPIFIKGLVIVGFLAVIMSTADSWLNMVGVVVAHNLVKPFYRDISDQKELFIAKLATFGVGSLSVLLALSGTSVIGIIWFIATFNEPLLFVPVVAGFLGFRTNEVSYIIAIFMAMVGAFLGAAIEGSFDVTSLVFGLAGSAFGLFSAHYLQKLYVMLYDISDAPTTTSKHHPIKPLVQVVVNAISKTMHSLRCESIIRFCNRGASICRPQYQQFALLGLLYCLYPVLGILFPVLDAYSSYSAYSDPFGIFIRGVGAIGCLSLLFISIHGTLQHSKYTPVIWHAVLLWCLPLLGTYNLFVHSNDPLAIYSIGASFLLATYVDARSFLVLMLIGSFTGYLFNILTVLWLHGVTAAPNYDIVNFGVLIYVLLVGALSVMMRRNQEQELYSLKAFSGAIAHEVRTPMASAFSAISMMVDAINRAQVISGTEKQNPAQTPQQAAATQVGTIAPTRAIHLEPEQLTGKKVWIMSDEDYDFVQYVKSNIQDVLSHGIKSAQMILTALSGVNNAMDHGQYSVLDTIQQALQNYPLSESQRARIYFNAEHDFIFDGSSGLLQHVIQNLLANAIKYAGAHAKIQIWVYKNEIHFHDDGIGIAPEKLAHIFDLYFTEGGSGIGLAFCKSVITGMGGDIACISAPGKGTEFIVTLKAI
ncbi:MAG: hypothetical protein JSS50_05170 [Proteobacteria bacterium]|nr:hypothetical protein [Pseudomonadota bacterium]